jgi:hypothetical protein
VSTVRDAAEFAWAVLWNWQALITGGIPSAVIAVWDRKKEPVSWRWFRWFVAIFACVAAAQAWVHQRNKARAAQALVAKYEAPKPRELGWSELMAIGKWFRHSEQPCRVRISATNENVNLRNMLAYTAQVDGECEVVNSAIDSRPIPPNADDRSAETSGVIVRGSTPNARALVKVLNGLGLRTTWGSVEPTGVTVEIRIGNGSPWN